MNPDNIDTLELAALCDALVDGTIDDARRQRLSRWLFESADARGFYVRYMDLSASLCHYAAELQTDAPDIAPPPVRVIRHPASWWAIGSLAAAAAILALFAASRSWLSNTDDAALDTDRFVAVLIQTKDCHWAAGSAAPRAGEQLSRGQVIAIDRGLAEIAFDCGAVVVVEGPATIEIDSAWAATLRRGTLRAQVPPEAIGFRISNPAVEVVDLGTEFTVVADDDGAAEVLVQKGSVEAAGGGTPLVLRETEGRRFARSGASDIHDRDRKLERLVQRLTLDGPPAPLAYARWSFDEPGGSIAVPRVVGMSAAPTNARIEPRAEDPRAEGRWGRALRLDGTIAATASFPGIASNSARTIAFWMRVPADALFSGGGTVLAWGEKGRGRKPGARTVLLGWNRHPGQGAVGALRADRGPDAVVGTTPLRDGRWHHVAATLVPASRAGKLFHVRLYVDGRLESTTVSKPKRPVAPAGHPGNIEEPPAMDTLWLGRAPGGRSREGRFRGELDELFIADRALTPQEIRRLMKTNDAFVPAIAAADFATP